MAKVGGASFVYPSVPYQYALPSAMTCKRLESTSILERTWAADLGRPQFKSAFFRFMAG